MRTGTREFVRLFTSLSVCLAIALAGRGALAAQPRCPGGADGIPMTLARGVGVLLSVTVNNTGPYTFLLDTGAQITTIDAALADRLHLQRVGTTSVVGVGTEVHSDVVQIERIDVGRERAEPILAASQDLGMIPGRSRPTEGILGDNFLERFDLLIDNQHQFICLDRTGSMIQNVRGNRIALLKPLENDSTLPFTQPFIVPGQLSGSSKARMSLQIDSGFNVPLLFAPGARLSHSMFVVSPPILRGSGEEGRIFATLPPQNLRLPDCCVLEDLVFVTPASERDRNAVKDVDGLIPTALFRSVFLSASQQVAVIVPW